jgi:hypothetical protein
MKIIAASHQVTLIVLPSALYTEVDLMTIRLPIPPLRIGRRHGPLTFENRR